jgi:hypothetical protein
MLTIILTPIDRYQWRNTGKASYLSSSYFTCSVQKILLRYDVFKELCLIEFLSLVEQVLLDYVEGIDELGSSSARRNVNSLDV